METIGIQELKEINYFLEGNVFGFPKDKYLFLERSNSLPDLEEFLMSRLEHSYNKVYEDWLYFQLCNNKKIKL